MRLATIIGRKRDAWECLACGNAGEVRPQFKRLDPASLKGISEVRYFDTDGEVKKRFIREADTPPAPEPEKPVKKKTPSRT